MAICIVAIWLAVAQAGVTGVVVDASGAAVAGATITVEVDGTASGLTLSAADGAFAFGPLPAGDVMLVVTSPGFAPARVRAERAGEPIQIVLQPAAVFESVTVTASRGSDQLTTPSSSVVLTSAELATQPAVVVDDRLRNTAGFDLTRRSSSRVANPSSQGVSMRGLPGNAGSRTLVMADGLALNDAFGGWVYWNRVPEAAVDRIEIVRGAAGDLYGGDAVSGVIQLFTLAPSRPRLRTVVDAASPRTMRFSGYGGTQAEKWSVMGSAERLDTDGVPTVAAAERGPVDVPATSDYRTGFTTIGYASGDWQARGRAAVYEEERGNGTPLVINNTRWHELSGDVRGTAAGGSWDARVSSAHQRYFNNFSAVSVDRASERLTSAQWLPSDVVAFSGQWVRSWRSHVFLAGTDGHRTEGTVEETRFAPNGTPSGPFVSGGIERVVSAYGRAAVSAGHQVAIIAGLRADFWRSEPREAAAPPHAVNFLSPRVSIAWQPSTAIGVHASVTHAYRTPTLDELHRSSRVGNTATSGNPQLEPEVFTGVEAGLLISGRRASARVTAYSSTLSDAITNVTLSATPTLITRQKQNADNVRAYGMEMEGEYRPFSKLRLTGSLVLTSSRFRNEITTPALEGRRVPQIPRYQVAGGVSFADPELVTAALYLRGAGRQFEDDLNQLPLDPFAVVDGYMSRGVGPGVQVFAAVENLFDVEYQTGRTPVTKIGWPRTMRGGVRLSLP